ncbi:MAG: hypothetical protein Q8P95_02480 [bacterium]|nr:hypothetical protein [bacterium]
MLAEPHYPSKWSVVIVFLVIFLMIGGVFAWAFWLNFGTVHLSSDLAFLARVRGEEHYCPTRCDLELPPGTYSFEAVAEGYYPETFSLTLSLWGELSQQLTFRFVPVLQESPLASVPGAEILLFTFQRSGQDYHLYDLRDEEPRFVSSFQSLDSPKIHAAGNLAVVLDQGRIFFVHVGDGRKQRYFDDTVRILEALVSDGGERVLIFAEAKGLKQLWLWHEPSQELRPLSWYAEPGFVQWQAQAEHRLFVVSDQLQDQEGRSLAGDFVDAVSSEKVVKTGLFSYNLDTEKALLLAELDQLPRQLLRRGERYFVQVEEEQYRELQIIQ